MEALGIALQAMKAVLLATLVTIVIIAMVNV